MFDVRYSDWNHRRIKAIISNYGSGFFSGKHILDLGCGQGDVAAAFMRLGADVLCVDARPENIETTKRKFPSLKTMQADLDNQWPFNNKFDMILSLGLLCHLKNYENHIRQICGTAIHIVLETEVMDSVNHNLRYAIKEDKVINDLSFNGEGSLVSAKNIQNNISNLGATYKRADDVKLNSGIFQYDWKEQNNEKKHSGQRRLWFIRSNEYLTKLFENNKPNIPSPEQKIIYSLPQLSGTLIRVEPQEPAIYIPPKPLSQSSKKIAVCISGHLRTFEKTYKTFVSRILGGNQEGIDVFVHTWETMGAKPARGRNHDNGYHMVDTHSKMDAIRDIIKPTVLVVDNYNVLNSIRDYANKARITNEEKKGFYGDNLVDFCSMLYGQNQVCELLKKYEKQHNITYDIVIRMRPDTIFMEGYDFSALHYDNNSLYTPSIATFYHNGMNDQFAVGSSNSVKVYLSMYNKIIEYLNARAVRPLRPETLLRHHLGVNGIKVSQVKLLYYLLRCNGSLLIPEHNNQRVVNNNNLIKGVI